ncbi:VCBS domain-containing protein, partial [Sphingomonas sp. NSE70-1]
DEGASDLAGAATENAVDDVTPAQDTPATGQIVFSDVDAGDTPDASVSTAAADVGLVYTPDGGAPSALPVGLDADAIREAFSITTAGAWTYDPSGLDLEALGSGDTIELTYSVVVTDDEGLTDTVDVVITITGTNDAPVAVADTNATDPVVEAGVIAGDALAAGNVLTNDTDVDTGATKLVSAVNGLGTNVGAAVGGTYGSVTINADGSYSYSLNNADADTNALYQGQVVQDQFTYTMVDDFGATSTTTLTITITGTNDAPTVTALTGSVGEDGPTFSQNLLSGAADVDAGTTLNVVNADTSVTTSDGRTLTLGTHYTVSGSTFALTSAGFALFNSMPAGDTDTLVFHFGVSDSITTTPNTLTVTVNGAAEAAPTPVANDDVLYISSGTNPTTFSLSSFLGNDVLNGATFSIAAGQSATYDATTQTITLSSANPAPFTYTLTNAGGTDTATVTINVVQVTGGADPINLSADTYAASYFDLKNGADSFTGSIVIIGAGGDDRVFGGAADDKLDTKGGNNVMTGDAGSDDFILTNWSGMTNHVTDFEAGTSSTTVDQLHIDVGSLANEFSVGNNNTTIDAGELFINSTTSFANTAAVQAYIDSQAVSQGAMFVVYNAALGHAAVYYDANPSVAGGAVLVTELDNISLAGLGNVNSGDFLFI